MPSFRKAMANPDIVKRMTEQGIDITTGTPEEYTAFIKAETARWREVVKASGAKVD